MRVIRRYVDSNIGEALVDEHTAHYENPLKFSGKELDEITGLYDHGARNRNPVSTLWYGIDPLFEKYPDFSPYNYCGGNPVKLVDLDGRELIIKDDGESFVYDPTIGENTYYGDNRMIRGSVNALNMMNSTEAGYSLLKDLHSSNSIYTITNGNATVKSGASTIATYNQLGIINGTLLNANNYYEDIEVIAHELFHSYQYEKKQGGASVFNEIEAYIYQNIVLKQYYCCPVKVFLGRKI